MRSLSRWFAGFSPSFLDGLLLDARYGVRTLRHVPLVSAVVVACLGIAVAVGTSVFALADGLYLRRLAVSHPEQLVSIEQGGHSVIVPQLDVRALVNAPDVPVLAAYRLEPGEVAVDAAPDASPEWIDLVSGGYFDLLGVPPLLGRTLTAADEQTESSVAVISDHFRRLHFAAGVNPVGHVLRVNELRLAIVGVMPPSFQGVHFARQFDIAAPITLSPLGFTDLSRLGVNLIGRLKTPRDRRGAAAALQAALESCCIVSAVNEQPAAPPRAIAMADVAPDDGPFAMAGRWFVAGTHVPPVRLEDASRGLAWGVDYRRRYERLILIGSAGALLLVIVCCANVAMLLSARGEQREREFAVRIALGASRRRLARQLFVEAGQLVIAGGVLGVALAVVLSRWMLGVLGLSTNGRHGTIVAWDSALILLVPATLILLCTIVVTVWPARRASRANLLPAMAGTPRRSAMDLSFERMLVLVQGALAVVLASTALLFMTTVAQLTSDEGGYRSRDVLLARIETADESCAGSRVPNSKDCNDGTGQRSERLARFDELIRTVRTIPGVGNASVAGNAPVIQDEVEIANLRVGDMTGDPQGTRISIVGAGFFGAAGVGLIAGRDFRPSDVMNAERVAIISQSMAQRHYARALALGRIIDWQTRSGLEHLRIVGIADDAKFDPMSSMTSDLRRDETEMVYLPLAQIAEVPRHVTLVIRTSADPAQMRPIVRRVVSNLPGIVLRQLVSLPSLLEQGSARERLSGSLLTGAGGVSFALVGIGLFAMLQYSVQRRKREFGIRLAVGARWADVLALVLRDALRTGVIAVVVGVPGALVAHEFLRAELFGVAPGDPRVLGGVAAAVVLLCVGAGLVPSLRAAGVDPLEAIRDP